MQHCVFGHWHAAPPPPHTHVSMAMKGCVCVVAGWIRSCLWLIGEQNPHCHTNTQIRQKQTVFFCFSSVWILLKVLPLKHRELNLLLLEVSNAYFWFLSTTAVIGSWSRHSRDSAFWLVVVCQAPPTEAFSGRPGLPESFNHVESFVWLLMVPVCVSAGSGVVCVRRWRSEVRSEAQ